MTRLTRYISLFVFVQLVCFLGIINPVQAADPELTVSEDEGKYGDSIKLKGTDFDPNETVTITFSGNDDEIEVDANSSGDFSVTFKVPSCPGGDHSFIAEGDESGLTAEVGFEVLSYITLSKTSGDPGSLLTVYGYGFGDYESGITITFNGSQVGTAKTASTLGYFTNTVTIPTLAAGTYSLVVAGNDDSNASASFTINVNAKISTTKTSGPAGTAVTISGTGFAPNEAGVSVTLGGKIAGSSTSANSSGSWAVTFTTPVMAGGSYNIDASGNTTNSSLVNDLSFRVDPSVEISPVNGSPGSTISMSGTGFYANETVTIIFDSTDLQSGIKADSEGSFSGQFTVPAGSSGAHKVYAKGTSTAKWPTTGLEFKVGAGLSINKASGTAGTSVTITGSGFAAKETEIKLIFDESSKTEAPGAASDAGSWTSAFTIPATYGGEHKIDAEGKTTKAATVTECYFTVLPEIFIDKTEGAAGTSVIINANGFAPSESGITISFDGKALGSKIAADANGAWKTTLTIPPSSSGEHTLQVNSLVTNSSVKGNFSFSVTSTMSISPDSGYIGSQVTVTGSGFAPNSSVRFAYDGFDIKDIGLVNTDKNGNFNKTLSIPKSEAGSHVISVQDSQSNRMEVVFEMDSEGPPVPRQSEPEDSASLGLFGNITPTLEWAKVSDPSGVTYHLQLDSDPEFGDPIIDITDAVTNKYSLKKADALPRGEYYWRVQAVDGAGNSSEWTDPRLLISGKMSPVIFILIILLVLVVIAAGVFFLITVIRRKTKSRQPQTVPEIVIPEVVNADYRQIEGEKKALPWRLALPQAPQTPRGSKSGFSEEDQARLKVIIDFAKSVPLAEPGANTNWLVDLAENNSGQSASPALYSQLVKGELQLHYEPAWMKHPTYMDLQTLLEGQSLLQDLNAFIDSVDRTAAEAEATLGEIYSEIATEIRWDIFPAGGWAYISGVYIDAFNWFQGKYLKEPSERDYSIKAEPLASSENGFGLYAEAGTPFAGLLVQVATEQDAQDMRALHLKLRRNFRNNERIKAVVSSIIQLGVQRNRLINTFRQFSRLTPS